MRSICCPIKKRSTCARTSSQPSGERTRSSRSLLSSAEGIKNACASKTTPAVAPLPVNSRYKRIKQRTRKKEAELARIVEGTPGTGRRTSSCSRLSSFTATAGSSLRPLSPSATLSSAKDAIEQSATRSNGVARLKQPTRTTAISPRAQNDNRH
jgi:hypothetical protein